MEEFLLARNMAATADLANYFLEAVDQAAIASASWRGLGDKNAADAAAVEAMRKTRQSAIRWKSCNRRG